MKKSTIIAAAFGAFIVLFMLVYYIDAKRHEGKENNGSSEYKEYRISEYSVIVAEKGADVRHRQGGNTYAVRIEYSKEKPLKDSLFKQENDTLYIYGGNTVYTSGDKLKSIIGRNANIIYIYNLYRDTFSADVKGGSLFFNFHGSTELNNLIINAQDADITFYENMKVNDFRITTSNSKLFVNDVNLNNIKINLTNKSKADFGRNVKFKLFDIQRDSTSYVSIN